MDRLTPEELCFRRQMSGFTQSRIAQLAGVSRTTWFRYEKGERPIPHKVAKRVEFIFSDDPLRVRRDEIAEFAGYYARTQAELREQCQRFIERAYQAWQSKPVYVDEHGITRRRSDNAPCGPRGGDGERRNEQ